MGLEWEPLPRPNPEHAEEFASLLARLQETGDQSLLDQINKISTPVFATLGAPRIGYDDAADEWLRTKVGDDEHYDMLMKMQGFPVLELLPPCDGFPVFTIYSWTDLDRYSLRGPFLDAIRDDLGPLYDEGTRYQTSAQLEDYGERLTACARRFARKHRIMEIELVRELPDAEAGSVQSRAHIMFAAARWCLYWSRRGHGLAPWL
jgi:hypothetical protein